MGGPQANDETDQRVQCLVGRLARFETIIDLVLPWTHLHSTDEFWPHGGLAVQRWEQCM
jgi:hypothetical protein